jgi:hypothetical protein
LIKKSWTRTSSGLPCGQYKSKVRAKVEHPIGVFKRVFGFVKLCYRGLKKNAHRLFVTARWPICSWPAGT